jgi:atlastin
VAQSAKSHPYGQEKQIATFGDNVEVNYDAINVLLHPEIADRKVVVYSIVGVYRKGKSFFLSYCLRYLYANYKSINFRENPLLEKSEWIGNASDPLIGFPWKSSSESHTRGILMWSDVFLCDNLETGEKYAIILIDTQGFFDGKSDSKEAMRIFSLNALLSSFLILNMDNVIQENILEYLQVNI